MSINIILTLTFLLVPISSDTIPYINGVIFAPASNSTSTTFINVTCNECLCMSLNSSDLLLNCMPNNTCQFFSTFPRTYNIQNVINASLYFLRGIFPDASQCCMPNLTYLLNKLQNATRTYANISNPRCLAIDNYGYLVTLSLGSSSLVRFNPTNMTLINEIFSLFDSPYTLKYYNGNYYVGVGNEIVVVDSNNLTIQNNITAQNLSSTRDMMFLNNGDTLVAVSTGNSYLIFFNRSSNTSTNYNFAYEQFVNYTNPHGLYYVNDTYFYTTSWQDNTVYSYSAVPNSARWNQALFINAQEPGASPNGNHITTDECGRFWFSSSNDSLLIFNSNGSYLDRFTITGSQIFDTIITNNYVMYLSDDINNRVIRIDSGIEC